MLKAVKGNKLLRIPDEKLEAYKNLGYTISTMDGKLVYEPADPAKELKKAEAKIADLEARAAKQEAETKKAKGSKAKARAAKEDEPEVEAEPEAAEE